MSALDGSRFLLYPLLIVFSAILIGLTASRIQYTKSLSHPDILTTRTHFYDPRIVALLVGSILALLFSTIMLIIIAVSENTKGLLAAEHAGVWILWIYILITAALVTSEWSNLKWCRSTFRVCRVLESIKAFSWICWAILCFLLIVTFFNLFYKRRDHGSNQPAYRQARNAGPVTTSSAQAPATTNVPTPQGVQTSQPQPVTGQPAYQAQQAV